MDSITLQTRDNAIASGDVIGRLGFAASSESDGTNATLVAAKIETKAEKTFSASNNAASMVFYLANDGAAASKMTLSPAGNLTVAGDLQAVNGTLSGLTVDSTGGIKVKNGDTGAGFVEFYEDSDNGTNKVTLIGRTSTGSDLTVSLPAYTGTLVCSAGTHTITASAATDTPIKLKGAGGQSANLQEWLDSGDNQLLAVANDGGLIIKDGGNIGSASATDAISIASTGRITHGYGSTPKTLAGGTSGDVDLNANLSNYFTIAAAGTLNILVQNAEAGQRILLRIVTGGHGANITWDGTMSLTWPGGTAPTFTTNGTDVIGLLCTAANTFDGFIIGQNIS